MKKLYLFVAFAILGVLGFKGYAQEANTATVTINGSFYTFVAQNPDNTRDEAFDFTNDTYDNETQEFTFTPDVTYVLKGQNPTNTFYVYVNGVQLNNTVDADQTGYEAPIQFKAGDEIEIYQDTPYVGKVLINGQFYTFAAQAGDDNRDEPFAFTNGTYNNESQGFFFSPAVTYTLKGQNEKNSFFVYVNGVQLNNTVDADQTGYEAEIKFNIGDLVEIYEETPYVGNVTVDGQFYTFVAQNPDNTRDEVFDFTNDTYDNETKEFNFSPAVTYTLKGQNETNSFFVSINGIEIPNEAEEGQTGFVANVNFNAGDEVFISSYAATVTINGQFYTFVAQGGDDNREEAFVFTNATYDNKTQNFAFNPEVTYTLKGQNESNSFFVYINGVQLNNQAGDGETGYFADVKFNSGDVVEILEENPYIANVTVDGQFYTFVAQNPDNTRDEAFDFTNDTYDNASTSFSFNPGVTYTLKGQNQTNSFFVSVNGKELVNEAGEGETGYVANVKFEIGDEVFISSYAATVIINGQFNTFVAQNPDNTRDEAFDFTRNTYDNQSQGFSFNPDVTYTLKGQNENKSFFVYVNGVQLNNATDIEETGMYEANIQFNIGDVIEIFEATPYTATVTIDGQFFTFVAQNPDNTRDEAFAFTNDIYSNETQEFNFSPAVTYTLKGQNENDSFYVYVNGVQLNNTVDADQTGYEATIQFNAGDQIAIYQATPYTANVTIDGEFYTFVAQNPDNTRDEAFAFTYNTYNNETQEFTFSPAVTYTLKGQNENNTFYVYVNGVQLNNQAGEGETGYVADIQFNAGDQIAIYQATPYTATVKIDGQFYTFVAQGDNDNRNEAFDFTYNTYNNETQQFTFSPAVTYTLKGQNENNSFYVYVNGVQLNNQAGEGETGYVADIKFNAGDVVEIYENTPYTAIVTVDGQFYTFVAQNPANTRDEAFDITYGTYNSYTEEFNFNPGVTYTLKGYNESNSFYVYVNGVQLNNQVWEGQSGFEASVTFKAGDVVEIFESTPYVASVSIEGQFYTFVAQNPNNTRDEAFAFTNGTYKDVAKDFNFSPGVTYTLKGQNESNSIYVYINGVEVKNQAWEGQTGFVADVTFNIGDIVEIYENTPYVATVSIDGQFYTFVAQNPNNTREEAFAFTNEVYEEVTEEFTFSPTVTYTLKGQNESDTIYVYVNGIQLENEAEEGQTGFVANIMFDVNDVIEIYGYDPLSGINDINIDNLMDGKVYNLQGIEMNTNTLKPGIYITNGKKIIIR